MSTIPQQTPSHWYKPDGTPCHTLKGKNGQRRTTTLADAKKLGLYPSVTNILNIIGKPALENWKINQCLKAAAESPRKENELVDDWITRVSRKGLSSSYTAADFGSRIHKALERWFDEDVNPSDEILPYVKPVIEWHREFNETHEVIGREMRVVDPSGFAGTADCLAVGHEGLVVLDYKSRKTNPKYDIQCYETDVLQLAAYIQAASEYQEDIKTAVGYNVFISSTEPGRISVVRHENMFQRAIVFNCAFMVWMYKHDYDPGARPVAASIEEAA